MLTKVIPTWIVDKKLFGLSITSNNLFDFGFPSSAFCSTRFLLTDTTEISAAAKNPLINVKITNKPSCNNND